MCAHCGQGASEKKCRICSFDSAWHFMRTGGHNVLAVHNSAPNDLLGTESSCSMQTCAIVLLLMNNWPKRYCPSRSSRTGGRWVGLAPTELILKNDRTPVAVAVIVCSKYARTLSAPTTGTTTETRGAVRSGSH